MKNILVPIDFSDVASSVLSTAEQMARAFGAKLYLLNCVPESTDVTLMGEVVGLLPMPVEGLPGAYPEVYRKLASATSTLRTKGIDAELLFVSGQPIDSILATIEEQDIDLVIMGSHGHGALYEILIGSVTEGVLRRITCPSMIVPCDRRAKQQVASTARDVMQAVPAATPY